LDMKKLKNAVFLIIANKQDVKDAMTADEIMISYSLGEIKNHKWHLQVK
jgi:signal recognition particle receptor subunit beta